MNQERKNNCLYRAYDDNGSLLYVGISCNIAGRTQQHELGSEWHELAVKITIERFDNRAIALEAEKQAIIKERPIYNKVHSPEYKHKEVKSTEEKKPYTCREQLGFFVTPGVKAKLQSLSMENNRTMSAQLTEMINREYKKMLSAQLRADQSQALSK